MSTADLFILSGLVTLTVGFALVWLPLGVLTAGAALTALGLGWDRDR